VDVREVHIDFGALDVNIWGLQISLNFWNGHAHISLHFGAFEVQVKVGHGDLGGLDVHLGHLELGAFDLPLGAFQFDVGDIHVHFGAFQLQIRHFHVTFYFWGRHVHFSLHFGTFQPKFGHLEFGQLEFSLRAMNVHIGCLNVHSGAFDVQFRALQVTLQLWDGDINVPLDLGALEVEVNIRHGDLGGLDVHLGHLELGAFDLPL
ncbi:hypothetical protein DV515_00019757, partial [Chloebia gouldiae]